MPACPGAHDACNAGASPQLQGPTIAGSALIHRIFTVMPNSPTSVFPQKNVRQRQASVPNLSEVFSNMKEANRVQYGHAQDALLTWRPV